MKKYKLNWRYWFFVILFSGILVLGAKVMLMGINGEIVDENGAVIEGFEIISVLIGTVLMTYLVTVISLLTLYIKNKGCGLMITDNGIENTVVIIKLFAFVTVLPVRKIPWESIKYYDNEENHLYIRVKKKEIEAGFFAKFAISLMGYSFCHGFVKPDVVEADIEKYRHRFSVENDVLKNNNKKEI